MKIRSLALVILFFMPPWVSAQGMKSVADPSDPHGMVISSVDLPAKGIFAVNIKAIDGGEIPPFPSGVWLKPGEHEIKGFGVVDRNWVSGQTRRTQNRANRGLKPIVLDVVEGQAYYIGMKATGSHDEWELVVWKTEEL